MRPPKIIRYILEYDEIPIGSRILITLNIWWHLFFALILVLVVVGAAVGIAVVLT